MVLINSEGKIDDSCYLIDGMVLGLRKFLAIYVIENNGERLMIDVGEALKARKVVKKNQGYGAFSYSQIITNSLTLGPRSRNFKI